MAKKNKLTSAEMSSAIQTVRQFQKHYEGFKLLGDKLDEVQATLSGEDTLATLRENILEATKALETAKTEASNVTRVSKDTATEMVEAARSEAAKLIATAQEEVASLKKESVDAINKTVARRRKVLNELEEDIGEAALKLQALQQDVKTIEEQKAKILSSLAG